MTKDRKGIIVMRETSIAVAMTAMIGMTATIATTTTTATTATTMTTTTTATVRTATVIIALTLRSRSSYKNMPDLDRTFITRLP